MKEIPLNPPLLKGDFLELSKSAYSIDDAITLC